MRLDGLPWFTGLAVWTSVRQAWWCWSRHPIANPLSTQRSKESPGLRRRIRYGKRNNSRTAKSEWKASGMRLWPRAVKYILGLAAAAVLFAQGPRTFRVDVQLVRILATVKDASGGLVANLNKDDFELFDNGAPQTIRVFEKHTSQPLSV